MCDYWNLARELLRQDKWLDWWYFSIHGMLFTTLMTKLSHVRNLWQTVEGNTPLNCWLANLPPQCSAFTHSPSIYGVLINTCNIVISMCGNVLAVIYCRPTSSFSADSWPMVVAFQEPAIWSAIHRLLPIPAHQCNLDMFYQEAIVRERFAIVHGDWMPAACKLLWHCYRSC